MISLVNDLQVPGTSTIDGVFDLRTRLHSHSHPQPLSSVSSTTTPNDTLPIQARTPNPPKNISSNPAAPRAETKLSPCPTTPPPVSLSLPIPPLSSFRFLSPLSLFYLSTSSFYIPFTYFILHTTYPTTTFILYTTDFRTTYP